MAPVILIIKLRAERRKTKGGQAHKSTEKTKQGSIEQNTEGPFVYNLQTASLAKIIH